MFWASLQAGFAVQCEMLKTGCLLPLTLEPRSATAATVLLRQNHEAASTVGVSIPTSAVQISYRWGLLAGSPCVHIPFTCMRALYDM